MQLPSTTELSMWPIIIGLILLITIAILIGFKIQRHNAEKIGGNNSSTLNEIEGCCCGQD